jgi:uncharacterized protein YxjI
MICADRLLDSGRSFRGNTIPEITIRDWVPNGRIGGFVDDLAMRYVMKQKIWSLGDDFTICDDQGHQHYQVDGRAFSFGKKLSFQDLVGNEVAFIREVLLSWGPTYEIHRPGLPVTIVKKELFTFFKCRFTVDGPGDQDFDASGDFMDYEYEISGHCGLAARVSKRWFSWSDTYGIEIDDREDPVLLLATAVVIDLICHDGDDD